jgi:tRNA A37 threonylcarbamoyladenosine dehydratase
VRQGLRKRKFRGNFTAVYSPERVPRPDKRTDEPVGLPSDGSGNAVRGMWDGGKKVINGTTVTVTAVAGMILAGLVVKDVYERHEQ